MSTDTEANVREALRQVHYPDVTNDVVRAGMIKSIDVDDSVAIQLVLPTMVATPKTQEDFIAAVRKAAEGVTGGKPVAVSTETKVASMPAPADKNRLPGVKNIIAVAAGKGGVGKSTVSTNLALALRRWGAKVGLLDADVFGPSIPTMLGTPSRMPGGTPDKRIAPAIYFQMPVISVGHFVEKGDAVVWRGPMLHKLLQQFLEDVDWGELDYLVVDLPPGTGDVQLSLSQLIPVTGAVMVTTPQEISTIDVVKGIAMFDKVEVPLFGIIENMSHFTCPGCGHVEDIFGAGGGEKLAREHDTAFLGSLPMHRNVRIGGDVGVPVVEGEPDSDHAKLFADIAARVAGRVVARVLSGPRRSAQLVTLR